MPPLRRLRRLKGWTQRQLADAAGVGLATVNRLERGLREPRPGTMVRLAQALGVKIGDVDEFREDYRERDLRDREGAAHGAAAQAAREP